MHIDLTITDNLSEALILSLISEQLDFVKKEGFDIELIQSSLKNLNLMSGMYKKYYLLKDSRIEYTLEIFYTKELNYLKIFTFPI